MKVQKVLKQVVGIVFLTVLLLGVPRLAGAVADLFDYSTIDPDGAFARLSVHHIVQAAVFLVIMLVVRQVSALRFGFGWGDHQVGWFYVRLFALIFCGYTVVSLLIVFATGTFRFLPYPLTARNIAGQLGFQLLLSGPSEELIFRAFAITMLALLVNGVVFSKDTGVGKVVFKILGGELTVANLIAAIIFGLAHVGFSFAPFSLSYDTFQVIYAVILGLFYGVCYERSKSMVYPMMMHSISNVVAVSVSVIAGFMLG